MRIYAAPFVRWDRTKRLLVETNPPAQWISQLACVSSLWRLRNVFRREMKTTLAEHRRRMKMS